MIKFRSLALVWVASSLLFGCTTAHHGTFVASSYVAKPELTLGEKIGEVKGQSSQLWILYIFPMGGAPSTNEAVQAAKQQREGTVYLSDISIDDRAKWGFGYRKQTISVEADAYK